mgnify:FL=1
MSRWKQYLMGENLMSKQKIKCDVKNCEFNDNKKCLCGLETIKVCSCGNHCDCKDETICDSFKAKKEEE